MTYVNSEFDSALKSATKPTVVKFYINELAAKLRQPCFAIVGTSYGYVHTTGGDVRYWLTRNGARRWIRTNYPTISNSNSNSNSNK